MSEAQIQTVAITASALAGAYVENLGVGKSLLSGLGVSGTVADVAVGAALAAIGWYIDGKAGDYLMAFGLAYAVNSVL